MFGFGNKKKDEDEAKERAEQEQISQAMRNMSDQLASKGKQIADLEDELDDARKDAADKAKAEKALADARAELAKLKIEAAKAKAAEAAAATRAKAAAAAPASAPTPAGTTLGGAPETAPVAPTPGGLAAGVTAYVRQTGGKNLRLRNGPGLDTVAFAGLPPGTSMTLLEGPVQDDGYPWWRIRTVDGREGWVAGTELVTQPE
jgi:hypothetical protein